MNKIALLTVLAALATPQMSMGSDRKVVIGGDQWCPYVCDAGGDHGFSVELVEIVLKRNALKTEYVNSNFIRLISNIEKGYWDVVTGTDKNFSPKLLISKVPVAYTEWVFITRKDQGWVYDGIESLKHLRLGTVAGYVYSHNLTEYIEAYKDTEKVSVLFSSSPQEANLRKLLSNRIDVFIGDQAVINYWIEKNNFLKTDFKVSGVDFKAPLYCGLNERDHELASLIDTGIVAFSKTQEFLSLLDKYGIDNWEFETEEVIDRGVVNTAQGEEVPQAGGAVNSSEAL